MLRPPAVVTGCVLVAGCSTPYAPPPSATLAALEEGDTRNEDWSGDTAAEGLGDNVVDGLGDNGGSDTAGEEPARVPDPEPCNAWGETAQSGIVGDAALDEISGIAASRRNEGVLWVLEDHGGPADVVALVEDGTSLGAIHLDGVTNNDWEDLAVGNCPEGTCIFIGEIGDNDHDRPWHGVYRVAEPEVSLDGGLDLTVPAELFAYEYPDGPHDSEALAVLPDGTPLLFSKEYDTDQSTVYAFPTLDSSTTVTLEARARFATGSGSDGGGAAVTAADLWVDGSRLLVRTYAHIWEYRLPSPDTSGISALGSLTATALVTGGERQGESIAYSPWTRAYYTVSEDVNPPIWATDCADGAQGR